MRSVCILVEPAMAEGLQDLHVGRKMSGAFEIKL